jgi:hypothetical protein
MLPFHWRLSAVGGHALNTSVHFVSFSDHALPMRIYSLKAPKRLVALKSAALVRRCGLNLLFRFTRLWNPRSMSSESRPCHIEMPCH